MSDPLAGALSSLIGVIDLMGGRAVHAVAGNRERYQSTKLFWTFDGELVRINGEPQVLVDAYRLCGVTNLYVADLDGIRYSQWQWPQLQDVFSAFEGSVYADLGLHDDSDSAVWDRIGQLAEQYAQVTFVIATECAKSMRPLNRLLDIVGADRTAVSFDYRGGVWLSEATDENDWVAQCGDHSISAVIGLDLSAVGTGATRRTIELCKRLRPRVSDSRYLTGGGIRDAADADELIAHGADQLLLASWFTSPR